MHPKSATDLSQVRLAMTQWEEKWKAMMSELGGDVKIPDQWECRLCPKDVKEQMMVMNEIGQNYENFEAKLVSYTTNKTEQARGRQEKMHVPDGA